LQKIDLALIKDLSLQDKTRIARLVSQVINSSQSHDFDLNFMIFTFDLIFFIFLNFILIKKGPKRLKMCKISIKKSFEIKKKSVKMCLNEKSHLKAMNLSFLGF
jgi:hypothetical protein